MGSGSCAPTHCCVCPVVVRTAAELVACASSSGFTLPARYRSSSPLPLAPSPPSVLTLGTSCPRRSKARAARTEEKKHLLRKAGKRRGACWWWWKSVEKPGRQHRNGNLRATPRGGERFEHLEVELTRDTPPACGGVAGHGEGVCTAIRSMTNSTGRTGANPTVATNRPAAMSACDIVVSSHRTANAPSGLGPVSPRTSTDSAGTPRWTGAPPPRASDRSVRRQPIAIPG